MYDSAFLPPARKFIQMTIGKDNDLLAGGWFQMLTGFLGINDLQVVIALGSDKDPLGFIFLLIHTFSKNNPRTVFYFISSSAIHAREIKIGLGLGP